MTPPPPSPNSDDDDVVVSSPSRGKHGAKKAADSDDGEGSDDPELPGLKTAFRYGCVPAPLAELSAVLSFGAPGLRTGAAGRLWPLADHLRSINVVRVMFA